MVALPDGFRRKAISDRRGSAVSRQLFLYARQRLAELPADLFVYQCVSHDGVVTYTNLRKASEAAVPKTPRRRTCATSSAISMTRSG
jgi:hypothetical protein